jgi:plastocyanin
MSPSSPERRRQGVDYVEAADVQDLDVGIQGNKRKGRVTIEPFSVWMLVVVGVVFFFAGFFWARPDTDFTATNRDLNAPPAQSNPPAVQTSSASASAAQSKVGDASAAAVVQVMIRNMKFDPPNLEVKKGDTVEWKNDDITPHTATSATFDSASIAPETSWRHTFSEAGTFPYLCTFHPDMKGAVIVK